MADKAGKGKQEKKKDGAQASSQSHKQGIAKYFTSGRLGQKKVRRALRANGLEAAKELANKNGQFAFIRSLEASGLVERRQAAAERRRLIREVRADARYHAACARHEAERAAKRVAV